MKKLMTLIGAVATAFGLFAAGSVVTGSASFESGEDGIAGGKFTPGTGWTWAGDPLTLGTYGPDDAYVYPGDGNTRRTDIDTFATQDNYLKLETTKSEKLEFAAITGQSIFVDQLVQFTGFEEAPNFTDDNDTKIAVWMEEAVISEDDADPEVTATNLWITAGASKVPVQIGATNQYMIGKWYRLTIKAIPNILDDTLAGNRAGFVVYIDGKQVMAAAAKDLAVKSDLIDSVFSLYDVGSLFPAMNVGAISSVGYNGIGAIDDIVIDDQGPEFASYGNVDLKAEQLAITGMKVVKIDGFDVDAAGPWSVKPGSIVVTYARDGAYVVTGTPTATYSVTASGVTLVEKDFETVEADAQVVNVKTPAVTNYFVGAGLYGMISLLADGDVATFLDNATITNGDKAVVYELPADTAITVVIDNDVTTWNIAVAGTEAWVTDNAGAAVNFIKNYTFEDKLGSMALCGTVAGTVKAQSISNGDTDIVLADAGKVVTTSDDLLVYDGDSEAVEPVAGPDYGWYTYQIQVSITWSESENVVATNNGEQVESGMQLPAGATITFYPTVGSITNIVVDGEAVTTESPYTFTVKAQDSVLKVLAGETAAPVGPVTPGKEIQAEESVAQINESIDLKKKYLAAPAGATVGDDYYGYFDAVPGSTDGTVKFELNATGEAALLANANGEIVKINPDQIAALTTESGKFEVAETIPGFYYAVKQGNGVGTMKVIYAGVLATDANGVELDFKKFPGAGFYSIVVSPTPIAAAPTED